MINAVSVSGLDSVHQRIKTGEFSSQFHYRYARDAGAAIGARYVAVVEELVYLEWLPKPPEELATASAHRREPDVAIVEVQPSGAVAVAAPTEVTVAIDPELAKGATEVELTEPTSEAYRERFVEIRVRETGELVTVIELLSPTNNRKGSVGWHEYLTKRHDVLFSWVHLVELDLQRVFNTVYERGGYRYLLDYRRPVEPSLPYEDKAWLEDGHRFVTSCEYRRRMSFQLGKFCPCR